MPFHIICLETGETFPPGAAPLEWHSGEVAALEAEHATRVYGKKYKPRRVKGDPDAWKKREQARFDDGVYTKLPWHGAAWFRNSIGVTEHFAHVSKEKPGMVAFTESPEKGEADIRTRIKPGTYLDRYFSEALGKAEIQQLARDFAGKYEINTLKFATTEDEIARVYINGPRSCMSGPETGLYQSPCHPTRAYAAGDLAVAYLERGKSIIARSVVWPAKKLYWNIYGDVDRMGPLLRKDGYKAGKLIGAKLKRIEHNNKNGKFLVVPHIDGVGRVTDHGTHLTIGGDLPAATTSGLIQCPHGTQCNNCRTWGHIREQMHTTEDRGAAFLYCGACYKTYTRICQGTRKRLQMAPTIGAATQWVIWDDTSTRGRR